LPGTPEIGILRVKLKPTADMAVRAKDLDGEHKAMKRLGFAIAGIAALTVAACNSNNQDSVQNAEMNQPNSEELNEAANQAAMDAANSEAQALGAQEQQLQQENASLDNAVNPQEADEQNVSGM
jgi:hypothetical protein